MKVTGNTERGQPQSTQGAFHLHVDLWSGHRLGDRPVRELSRGMKNQGPVSVYTHWPFFFFVLEWLAETLSGTTWIAGQFWASQPC